MIGRLRLYVDELQVEFRKLAVHKDKVGKRSRCATVEYAGERKIGIARCVRGTVPSSGAAVLANAHSLVRRTSALTILMVHTSTARVPIYHRPGRGRWKTNVATSDTKSWWCF